MHKTMVSAKLHQARVTHSELEYEGSCAIDKALLDKAGIIENEQIHIYNMTNGERFITYAISAQAGSRIISVNGAAAHKANPGDRIIICAYTQLHELELSHFTPKFLYLDHNNIVVNVKTMIQPQMTIA